MWSKRTRPASLAPGPGATGSKSTSQMPDGALVRRRGVGDPQRDRADRRAMGDVEGMGEAFLLAVDDDVDVALAPAGDVLRLVLARLGEAEPGEQLLEIRGRGLVHRELDELDARARRARRQRRQARNGGAGPAPQLVEHEDQRALPVDRDAARRSGPEAVAEDLVREKPVVAGGLERVHEGVDRELALAGKRAVMAAPGEVVHFEERRVRELHQEDAVLGDRPHRRQVGLARQDMKRVEDEPDRWMVGAAHDLPGVAVVADVAAPGQGLVADAQAAFCRPLAELAEIGAGAVDAAERIRRNIAAHEKEIAA